MTKTLTFTLAWRRRPAHTLKPSTRARCAARAISRACLGVPNSQTHGHACKPPGKWRVACAVMPRLGICWNGGRAPCKTG
jgi:hypothetical protein